ncbi:hypothetical protein L2E82_26835 [Cichorium intybus]|uniref:Uncharacterized protein n=1 Tax=Cichorium intybus TaxID=13427 RepID=A0ACB9CRN9_CICIN|nr:hypothetical protein L2E82_26835 [Cichorium intybus]
MKNSFSGHQLLAAVYLCCLIATLQIQGISTVKYPEGNHKHHRPSRISVSCHCLRCRLLYKNLREETGTRFGTEKRLTADATQLDIAGENLTGGVRRLSRHLRSRLQFPYSLPEVATRSRGQMCPSGL